MFKIDPGDPQYRYPGFHVLVFIAALVLIHVLVFGRWWCKESMFLFQRVAKRFEMGILSPQVQRSPHANITISKRARERIERKRVERIRRVVPPFAHVALFALLAFLTLSLVGFHWPHHTTIEFCVCLGHVMLLTVYQFPRLLTNRTMDYMYSYCMLLVLVSAVVGFNPDRLAVHGEVMMGLRVFFSIVFLNEPLAVLWNFVYCVAVSAMFLVHQSRCEECPADYAKPFVARECINLVMIILVTLEWKRVCMAEEYNFAEAAEARNQRSAMRSLLGAVCDVVVKLDSTLTIAEESPQLSCMLMHGSGKSLKGEEFQRFIEQDDDRQRFVSSLAKASSTLTDLAGVHHTHLRDSLGNTLRIELFHAPLLDMDEQIGYLVGLRDRADELAIAPQMLPELGEGMSAVGVKPLGAGTSLEVSFNPMTMLLLGDIPSTIAELCGPGPGPWSFGDLLVDGELFREWMCERVNYFAYSDEPEWRAQKYGIIELGPLQQSRGSRFKVVCSVSLDNSGDDGDEDIVAHAVLTAPRNSKSKQRRPRRSGRADRRSHAGIDDECASLSSSSSGSSGSSGSKCGSARITFDSMRVHVAAI